MAFTCVAQPHTKHTVLKSGFNSFIVLEQFSTLCFCKTDYLNRFKTKKCLKFEMCFATGQAAPERLEIILSCIGIVSTSSDLCNDSRSSIYSFNDHSLVSFERTAE